MAPTTVNKRCMAICVVLLTLAGYILLWVVPSRELLPAMVVPTPTTESADNWILRNLEALDSRRQFKTEALKEVREMLPAMVNTTRAVPAPTKKAVGLPNDILAPAAQPARDWVFGNLAPHSPWKFNATALEEVRNITTRMNLKKRLQKHKWGNVTKDKAFPIGHYNACAVVGNSGVLLGSRCGAEIDSMDYVIRIDLPVLRGFEKDVGGKTSMTILNLKTPRRLAQSSHFKNRSLDVYESRIQDVKDSILVGDHRARKNIMSALGVYKLPFLVLTTKNRLRTGVMSIASDVAKRKMTKTATIGLVSVLMMTTFCDHAYIYGFFPFFKDKNNVPVPYHYYPHDNVDPPMWDGFDKLHNVNQEYDFHRELHRRGVVKMQLGPCGKR